ncbi:MAG: glycosyltransferase family 2 protein [Proteobacteria bacterium]|nr:glycosyltransferase family 2 protein [Pseudomonadota bacterium]
MTVFVLVSLMLAIFTLLLCAYLGVLAALAWRIRSPKSDEAVLRFAMVVPSHNEQENIGDTVRNLLSVNYPSHLRNVVVVADNCTDDTLHEAKSAGAEVLERIDEEKRGKGFALAFAFEKILREGIYDAVVVVDADTVVSENLLRAFETRLQSGEQAIQAEYGVRNVEASWRTRLMAIALGMFHRTRSLARERMGLSVGLRGNGMCFSTNLIKNHPHRAFSLVEDIEYGIELGLSGIRVAFAQEAYVLGEMVAKGNTAVSQRQRWERGRWDLTKKYFPILLSKAYHGKSLLLWDLAMDLLVPPLSYIGLMFFLGLGLECTLYLVTGNIHPSFYLWLASLLGLILYLARGIQHSGLGIRGLWVLCYAVIYVPWKILVARPFSRKGPKDWVRTEREEKSKTSD